MIHITNRITMIISCEKGYLNKCLRAKRYNINSIRNNNIWKLARLHVKIFV